MLMASKRNPRSWRHLALSEFGAWLVVVILASQDRTIDRPLSSAAGPLSTSALTSSDYTLLRSTLAVDRDHDPYTLPYTHTHRYTPAIPSNIDLNLTYPIPYHLEPSSAGQPEHKLHSSQLPGGVR